MKKLFTLAILTIIASVSFAQTPLQEKKNAIHKIERVVHYNAAKVREMKALEMKAKAVSETSTSVIRRAATPSAVASRQLSGKAKTIANARISSRNIGLARINRPMKAPAPADGGAVVVEKDDHGVITSVKGGTIKYYRRTGEAYMPAGQGIDIVEQTGVATIVEDADGTVYMLNPVSEMRQGSWIKGTKSGIKPRVCSTPAACLLCRIQCRCKHPLGKILGRRHVFSSRQHRRFVCLRREWQCADASGHVKKEGWQRESVSWNPLG